MRPAYIIVFIYLALVGCGPKERPVEIKKFVANDSVSEQTLVLDSLSSGDWFTAECDLLCDEEHGKFVDSKKLEKYDKYEAYDLTQSSRNDSTTITFDFIADCCMGFAGGAQLRNDTLIREYQPPNDSLSYGCDCYCDYRMTYRIDKSYGKWTALKTQHKERVLLTSPR